MSSVKTVAWGVLVWAAFGSVAKADRFNSRGNWIWYYYNNAYSTGLNNFYPYVSNANPSLPALPATAPAPTYSTPPVYTATTPQPSTAGISFTQPSTSAAMNTGSSTISIASPSMSAAIMSQNASSAAPPSAVSSPNAYDAVINFTGSNFLEANQLASGSPSAWYNSSTVTNLFHGTPSAQQQQDFTQTVLDRVNQTFNLAGLHPKITTDTSVPANHMISVVSNASYGPNAQAIGITDVGHNGFGFIDKLSYASSVDQLEWAVAHNVAHELMHAFGVANHPDTTGTYVDAGTASWDLLTNPSATFSPGAVSAITSTNYTPGGTTGAQIIDGDQEILAVPEPTTWVGWSVVLIGGFLAQRRRRSLVRA